MIRCLIDYRISRSSETLNDARVLIDHGSYVSAVNRLYYACFYSVLAALLTHGLSPKTHSGVRSLLGKHYVSTGMITQEMGSFFGEILSMRITGDYDEFMEFTHEEIEDLYQSSRMFIDRMNEIAKR